MRGCVLGIERASSRSGVVEEPNVTTKGYQLADPAHGKEKNRIEHAIYVRTLDEAASLIGRRYSLWMTARGKLPSLIAPKSLRIVRDGQVLVGRPCAWCKIGHGPCRSGVGHRPQPRTDAARPRRGHAPPGASSPCWKPCGLMPASALASVMVRPWRMRRSMVRRSFAEMRAGRGGSAAIFVMPSRLGPGFCAANATCRPN